MGSSLVEIDRKAAFEYCDEELFQRIAEDGAEFIETSFPNCEYIGIVKDSSLIGFWIVEHVNSSTLGIHLNMNQEDRKHNEDCGRVFLDFIFKLDWVNKVVAEVPKTYPEVIKYCEKHGLKKEGLLKEHLRKSGKYIDCYILGLTRGDYGSC